MRHLIILIRISSFCLRAKKTFEMERIPENKQVMSSRERKQVMPYGEPKEVTKGSVKNTVVKSLEGFESLPVAVRVMILVSAIFCDGVKQTQDTINDVLQAQEYNLFGDQVEKLAFLSMLFPAMVHFLHKTSSMVSGFALKAAVLVNSIKSKKVELNVETLKQQLPRFDDLKTLLCAAHERFINIFLGEENIGLQECAVKIAMHYMSGKTIVCDCDTKCDDCIYCSARAVANVMTTELDDKEDEIIYQSLVKTITTAKAIAEPDVSILEMEDVKPSNMVLMMLSCAGVPIWKLDLQKIISYGKTLANKSSSVPIKEEKAVNLSNKVVYEGMVNFLSQLKE